LTAAAADCLVCTSRKIFLDLDLVTVYHDNSFYGSRFEVSDWLVFGEASMLNEGTFVPHHEVR